jgi:hypothetical protein
MDEYFRKQMKVDGFPRGATIFCPFSGTIGHDSRGLFFYGQRIY